MKKTIILSDKGAVEMTFEEVLEQFKGMIERYVYTTAMKSVYNAPDRDELRQELRLQTWIAYENYNGTNTFSTYLVYRLQHGISKFTAKMYAKKRVNTAGTVSFDMNPDSDGEMEFSGLFGEEDEKIGSFAFREFLIDLEKKLDSTERQLLLVLMNKSDFSVQDLATKFGVSRQAANKKVNKFKVKMAEILKDAGFAC